MSITFRHTVPNIQGPGRSDLRYRRSCTKYRVRYDRVRYCILPMAAFSVEQRPSFPSLPYACDEESQRHVPWIPAPSFAQFYSLLHRALTRKGPSIVPHPHVDFEQPAPSPTAGSRICCSFSWDLAPEAVRNYID
jgi:hypothetical protein